MAETQTPELPENELAPFHVFRFQVSFTRANLPGAEAKPTSDVPLCSGAFAECTGIEATMEPKVIKAGGAHFALFVWTNTCIDPLGGEQTKRPPGPNLR